MTQSQGPPPIDYQSAQARRAELAVHTRRAWLLVGKCVAGIVGAVVLVSLVVAVIGFVGRYLDARWEQSRHHTTVEEVRGWCSTLPPNATREQFKALFASKGMACEVLAADFRSSSVQAGYDPADRDILYGTVRDVRHEWDWRADINVIVRFDNDDHAKSVVVEERQLYLYGS